MTRKGSGVREVAVMTAPIGGGGCLDCHSIRILTDGQAKISCAPQARLQFNAVFGYSPTVGIRLAGIGNPGSAQVSICALLFAILITGRVARRGAAIGDAVLV